MKRKSNKKRKLEYIREKNWIRSGGYVGNVVKVTLELKTEDISQWFKNEIPFIEKRIFKKWHLDLRFHSFSFGSAYDDAYKGLFTVYIISCMYHPGECRGKVPYTPSVKSWNLRIKK